MRPTTYPAVKRRLRTLLTDALPGVQVEYGDPGAFLEQEYLIVGDMAGLGELEEQDWATIGAYSKDEAYAIAVSIWAGAPDQTQEEADVRAEELFSALFDALAGDDLTLGVPGVLKVELARGQYYDQRQDHGHATQVDTAVRVSAYLT